MNRLMESNFEFNIPPEWQGAEGLFSMLLRQASDMRNNPGILAAQTIIEIISLATSQPVQEIDIIINSPQAVLTYAANCRMIRRIYSACYAVKYSNIFDEYAKAIDFVEDLCGVCRRSFHKRSLKKD